MFPLCHSVFSYFLHKNKFIRHGINVFKSKGMQPKRSLKSFFFRWGKNKFLGKKDKQGDAGGKMDPSGIFKSLPH